MIKFIDEYRNPDLCATIVDKILSLSSKKINIMEVCGGHTMAIRKNGIHKLVGDNINLISGPGCPVCVTSMKDIDTVIELARVQNTVICTFGDLFYVPGTRSSLAKTKANGADVRVVYSVYDALVCAKNEKKKNIIFVSIGFEATAPTAAAAVLQADEEHLDNFFIFCLNKTMPHALRAVLENKHSTINALIAPGHVSTITGLSIYRFIVDELKLSCCISGFEPADILTSIYILVEQFEKNQIKLVNAYNRAVKDEGNRKAQDILAEVFIPCDVEWRGLGSIPSSGLILKSSYRRFNAREKFEVHVPESKDAGACICGDILIGIKKPADCSLFGKQCTPSDPYGACMVSSEGSCAAWYNYGE